MIALSLQNYGLLCFFNMYYIYSLYKYFFKFFSSAAYSQKA